MASLQGTSINGKLIMHSEEVLSLDSNTQKKFISVRPTSTVHGITSSTGLSNFLGAAGTNPLVVENNYSDTAKIGFAADESTLALWSGDGGITLCKNDTDPIIAKIDKAGRYLPYATPEARTSNFVRIYRGSSTFSGVNESYYQNLSYTGSEKNKFLLSSDKVVTFETLRSEVAELENGKYIYAVTVRGDCTGGDANYCHLMIPLWFRVWLPYPGKILSAAISPVVEMAYEGVGTQWTTSSSTGGEWFIKDSHLMTSSSRDYIDVCLNGPLYPSDFRYVLAQGFSMMLVCQKTSESSNAPTSAATSQFSGDKPGDGLTDSQKFSVSNTSGTIYYNVSGSYASFTAYTYNNLGYIDWSVSGGQNSAALRFQKTRTVSGESNRVYSGSTSGGSGSVYVVAYFKGIKAGDKTLNITVTENSGSGGGSSGGCFEAGTRVLLANGVTKNIEDVKIGDYILSYDIITEEISVMRIDHTYKLKQNTGLVRLKFSDGTILDTTNTHPFFTASGWVSLTPDYPYDDKYEDLAYKEVNMMKVGQMFCKVNENNSDIKYVKLVEIINKPDAEEDHYVYNLDVARHNTFFTNGILGHNVKEYTN